MEGEYKKLTCNSMLIEIIDVAVMNISGRFCDVSQLKYCAFIISEISQTTSVNSPWKHWISWWRPSAGALIQWVWRVHYGSVFECWISQKCAWTARMANATRTERCVLSDLQLAKLILTIPATNVSTERSRSAPERIQNYLRKAQGQKWLPSLSRLTIIVIIG